MKLRTTEAARSFDYGWLLSRIFPYIKPFLGRVIFGFLVAIPVGMLDGIVALALKPYMDLVVEQKNMIWAYIIPLGIVGFAGLQGVLKYLNEYMTSWTSMKITNSIKKALFKKLIMMNTKFYDINSSGEVLTRYLGDVDTASNGIVEQIKSLATNSIGALSLICVMLYSSWSLAIIGVIVLCVAFIPVLILRKRVKDVSNKGIIIGGKITTIFNETYSGNKVITSYGLQGKQSKDFSEQIDKAFSLAMSLTKRAAWMSPLMYLIASVGIAIVMGYGTYLILSGNMTTGSFASFVTSLLLLYKPVKTLGHTMTKIQTIFVAMGRMFELFDLEPEFTDCENAVELNGLDSSVKFNNVSFEYNEGHPVLASINLTVKKGETIAIVGNSGGGKTTLVNLLPRFYDVTSGAILFDDIDIRKISLSSLRMNIATVFQDNFLFTGTIRDNIMMGNPDATDAEIGEVVHYAHIDEMLENMPDGLDTLLGERGLTLSGGQRQRVAIARAMIKKAPIIVLDEATSALDNESEAIVQAALDNLMHNKTVFVIAHRLSTIKNADRIAVLNEGHLVELGTHEELMAIPSGCYKNLYEMQFRTQDESSVQACL